jgi:hypothetical protein
MWEQVWTRLHERINVVGDPATKDPARIFYLPQYQYGRTPDRKIGHGEFLDAGLGELFVPPRFTVAATMPKAVQGTRRVQYWESEAWWNEPQDLSRFTGMTQPQIAAKLLDEFQALRKSVDV